VPLYIIVAERNSIRCRSYSAYSTYSKYSILDHSYSTHSTSSGIVVTTLTIYSYYTIINTSSKVLYISGIVLILCREISNNITTIVTIISINKSEVAERRRVSIYYNDKVLSATVYYINKPARLLFSLFVTPLASFIYYYSNSIIAF